MRNIMCAALILCGLATPAKAHWQYTRWGMTPAQVITASNGTAKSAGGEKSAQGDTALDVEGEYSAGDRSFRLSFWFSGQALQKVTLSPKGEGRCLDLRRDLLARYGEPIERDPGSIERLMWAERSSGNRIVIITDGDSFCELQYAPLISRSGAAL